MSERKTFVVDIDGTLGYGADENYDGCRPYHKMIYVVNSLHEKGNRIVVFTARGMRRFDGNVAKCHETFGKKTYDWLIDNGVQFDLLKFGKPAADLYIDDKGIDPERFIHEWESF